MNILLITALLLVSIPLGGRVRPRTSLDQTAEQLNVGTYSSDAHVFTGSVTLRF